MADTRDGRPHRWINSKQAGATAFVTTTCLDFVHTFRREEMRDLAARSIVRDARRYEALLHCYVVMPHHLHFLITCPEEKNISWLVQRMKTNLATLALPELTPEELSEFDQQRELNKRSFWKPSFRGTEISSTKAFYQKALYVHLNPVRAGYVDEPGNYRWSSRRFWDSGLYDLERGLDLGQVLSILTTE
ncbi:MAG: transposase [Chlorobia bacterium]|nr:transposase [Fimbriimonadaceae bacterium]